MINLIISYCALSEEAPIIFTTIIDKCTLCGFTVLCLDCLQVSVQNGKGIPAWIKGAIFIIIPRLIHSLWIRFLVYIIAIRRFEQFIPLGCYQRSAHTEVFKNELVMAISFRGRLVCFIRLWRSCVASETMENMAAV